MMGVFTYNIYLEEVKIPKIDMPPGEIFDRLSIIRIKSKLIPDVTERDKAIIFLDTFSKEVANAMACYGSVVESKQLAELLDRLDQHNIDSWNLRNIMERVTVDDDAEAYRRVALELHEINLLRREIKNKINKFLGYDFVEQTSLHAPPTP